MNNYLKGSSASSNLPASGQAKAKAKAKANDLTLGAALVGFVWSTLKPKTVPKPSRKRRRK